jgi:fluoroquinolone transport system permease protein
MRAGRMVRALGPLDGRNLARDPLLRGLCVAPVLLAAVMRWVGPPLVERIGGMFGADLAPLYPELMGFFLLAFLPLLVGMVVGFLLLDQRDDGTLAALRATPLPMPAYLGYRLAVPVLASVLLTLALFPLAGLGGMGAGRLPAAAAATAPLGPMVALFLAAFAANKVQGFAFTKVSGVLLLPPLVAYFAAPQWQWLFWIAPTYWPARGFWTLHAGDAGAAGFLLVGAVYQLLLIALLLRRFLTVTSR